MATRPQAAIIAGPNGAGKTTTALALLPSGIDFINADQIAQRLAGCSDAPGEVEAMRILLKTIERLVRNRDSFTVETTLAPRSLSEKIPLWQEAGYEMSIHFLYLPSPELAVESARLRVEEGGHPVPVETIRRRFYVGLRNFFQVYRPLASAWRVFDCSGTRPRLIASGTGYTTLRVEIPKLWNRLVDSYSYVEP